MKLTHEQQTKIREQHGICVKAACNHCGRILGPVRYTQRDEPWEWCSKSCRDGIAVGAPKSNSKRCLECGVRLDGKLTDADFCSRAHFDVLRVLPMAQLPEDWLRCSIAKRNRRKMSLNATE
jgi:hypothetical protein